ncbi:predicted protein [Coccidioides posadasii str. Silveira]|uniref:Predicted protein n=1 Tax=Coccidioides posadasii (strain RMSCC 757 / Silveira) TaxID=443226 RepID=E9D551_COCPS|nr:predicted protein [Coccidioides posadasii str. Silveira]
MFPLLHLYTRWPLLPPSSLRQERFLGEPDTLAASKPMDKWPTLLPNGVPLHANSGTRPEDKETPEPGVMETGSRKGRKVKKSMIPCEEIDKLTGQRCHAKFYNLYGLIAHKASAHKRQHSCSSPIWTARDKAKLLWMGQELEQQFRGRSFQSLIKHYQSLKRGRPLRSKISYPKGYVNLLLEKGKKFDAQFPGRSICALFQCYTKLKALYAVVGARVLEEGVWLNIKSLSNLGACSADTSENWLLVSL